MPSQDPSEPARQGTAPPTPAGTAPPTATRPAASSTKAPKAPKADATSGAKRPTAARKAPAKRAPTKRAPAKAVAAKAAPPAARPARRNGRNGPDTEPRAVLDLTGDEPVIDLREAPGPARPVSGRPLDLEHGLTLRNLNVAEDGELYERAEKFIYDIYRASGYCDESPLHRVQELDAWRDDSHIWTVIDEDGEVLGTVRIIFGSWSELPVGQFERRDHRDADPVAELSSLAVAPTARGLSVVVHLCRAAFVHSWRRGASALVCLIDDWMVDLLVDTYALPMRPLGAQRHHMGGDVTPSGMSFQGAEFAETSRLNPGYWQWMTEAFSPDEIGRYDLPIVLTDPTQHPWMHQDRVQGERATAET